MFVFKKDIRLILPLIISVMITACGTGKNDSSKSENSSADLVDTIYLFNGYDLSNWIGKKDNWYVADDMIVGGTGDSTLDESSWMTTISKYDNFELTLWVKLLGDENRNSGIYYRGEWLENEDGRFVVGYEFDIGGWGEDDNANWWGELHDPFRRDDLWIGPGREVIDGAYKPEDWNHVRIRAEGNRIQHWLNGVSMVDWTEDDPEIQKSGFIALQMHGGTRFQVIFKDLKLVPL